MSRKDRDSEKQTNARSRSERIEQGKRIRNRQSGKGMEEVKREKGWV